ncbi:MAG: tRNA lysidine(34) synthetase TilS [Brumimicrobium sp.]|nr:tRNA lysidine(34) synthetase TilS [Brumimicrobium sp.]
MSMNKTGSEFPDFWIACSGGVDSVVAARLFHTLGKKIGLLHCNFSLRGAESDEDEIFVRELAAELQIPIRVERFDTDRFRKEHKLNTQLAARELRYKWFQKINTLTGSLIVLGHHKDDQIETILLQLRRGAKVNGLAGMPVLRDFFLRPLLKFSKQEILAIAEKNNWKWREDSSNVKNDYKRNLYRNKLIPLLKKSEIDVRELDDLSEKFRSLRKYLEHLPLHEKYSTGNGFEISVEEWEFLPLWVKNELLRKIGFDDCSVKHLNDLGKGKKGSKLGLKGKSVWREESSLYFELIPFVNNDYVIETIPRDEVFFGSASIYIDGDKISGEIIVRPWKKGDRFTPLGMKGSKLVSDYLTDVKLKANKKDKWPVVTDGEKILGIPGFVPDDNFKITDGSTKIIRISPKTEC